MESCRGEHPEFVLIPATGNRWRAAMRYPEQLGRPVPGRISVHPGPRPQAHGASVAVIARRHELNANVLFSWRRLYQAGRLGTAPVPDGSLIPVKVIQPCRRNAHNQQGSGSRS